MGFLSPDNSGWWSAPGRRLALASMVPLLVIGFLWWLSRRTWSAYESASPPPRLPGTSRDTPAAERTALSREGFWYGRRLVARLRAAHTTAGVLTVAAVLLAAAAKADRGDGGDSVLAVTGRALTALVIVLAAVTLVVVWRTARSEGAPDVASDHLVVRALPFASLGVLALTMLHTGWARPGAHSHGLLPGAAAFGGIAVFQGVLVLALAVTAWVLQRAARDDARTALRGMGGPAVALLACAVGGVLSGASPSASRTGWTVARPPVRRTPPSPGRRSCCPGRRRSSPCCWSSSPWSRCSPPSAW